MSELRSQAATHENALGIARMDDAQMAKQALVPLREKYQSEVEGRWIRHALLEEDRLDLHLFFAHPDAHDRELDDWCRLNTERVLTQCPAVLEAWAERYPARSLEVLMRELEIYPDAQRQEVFSPATQNSAYQCIQGMFAKYPDLWRVLATSWLGHPESSQRSQAVALGWKPAYLQRMLMHTFVLGRESISDCLSAHPFSYSIAACGLVEEYKSVNPQTILERKMIFHHNAQAEDMFLALRIQETSGVKTPYRMVCYHHAKMDAIPEERKQELRSMACMFSEFGLLADLSMRLACDDGSSTIETAVLPDIQSMQL